MTEFKRENAGIDVNEFTDNGVYELKQYSDEELMRYVENERVKLDVSFA